MPDSDWPARNAICLDCRATFTDPDEPHVHDHELISLRNHSDRERLLSRVWGRLLRRSQSSKKPFILSLVLGTIALAGAIAVFLPMLGAASPAVAVAGLLIALVASAMRNAEHVIPASELVIERERDLPLPAVIAPPRLAGGTAIVATVDPGPTAPSPITRTPAVAFAIILSADDHDADKLLRDCATVGFSLTTMHGDTIEISAGSIEIIAHGAPHPHHAERVEEYLDALDPLRHDVDDEDPFSYQHSAEIVVRPGDHVAVHNPIKRVSFAPQSGYRQARQVFGVEGTPCIELLP